MKQRILIAAVSVLLAALILLLVPLEPREPNGTISTEPSHLTGTVPGITNPTSPPPTTQPPEPAVVRLYSCSQAHLAAYAQMAEEYTAIRGLELELLGPNEGESCQEALARYLAGENPPTVFCVHAQSQLTALEGSLLDLSGTVLADKLVSDAFSIRLGQRMLGIPYDVEGYGLLANSQILGAVFTRDEITNSDTYPTPFAALTGWLKILKDNSIKPFAVAAFTQQDAWDLLMSQDLDQTRAFIDLYLTCATASGDAMALFAGGKTAFYLGGSRDYDALVSTPDAKLNVRDLDILPNYSAGAMQYICDGVWCVNANARQVDIDAALAFMGWLVTAGDDGAAPVDALQTMSPFADAAWYGNQLEKKLRTYMRTETAVLQWSGGQVDAESLLAVLNAYQTDRTDENWQQVCTMVESLRAHMNE